MWKLVQTINNALLENKLQEKVLKSVFETYWEQFSEKYKEISQQFKPEEHVKKRSNEELLTEILTTVRAIDKRSQVGYLDNYISTYDDIINRYWSPSEVIKFRNYMTHNKTFKDFFNSNNEGIKSNEVDNQEDKNNIKSIY